MTNQEKDAAPPFDRSAPVAPLAIPVLLTTDARRAKSTYENAGFKVTEAGPGYLILRGYNVEFHISQVSAIPTPHCVSAYLRVLDVAALYPNFQRVRSDIAPPADKPWGMREFHFIDPDGNLINIGEMID